MSLLLKSLLNLHRDEGGQGLVEYLLIMALVAFGCIVGMRSLASAVNNAFNNIGSLLNSAIAQP